MLTRIGIIGDVHAEHDHLARAIEHLLGLGVDALLCTGDVVDGQGDLDTCIDLLQTHQVRTVRGNHDRWVLENKARHVPHAHRREHLSPAALDYLTALPTTLTFNTRLGPLMLCHGVDANDLKKVWPGTPRMPVERCTHLDAMIADGRIRFMVNGHMHYRTLIHFNTLTLLNAGTLHRRSRPGFALLDTGAGEVRGYEFGPEIQEAARLPVRPGRQHQAFENTQQFDGQWEPVTLYA